MSLCSCTPAPRRSRVNQAKVRSRASAASATKRSCATVHHWANLSRTDCVWAESYYQQKKNSGMSHAAALRCLGQRWLKILWKMWQNHTTYDEALHAQPDQARILGHGVASFPRPFNHKLNQTTRVNNMSRKKQKSRFTAERTSPCAALDVAETARQPEVSPRERSGHFFASALR